MMNRPTPQEIKQRLDPASVVAEYTHQELRHGRNVRCPSQSHEDNNPSCNIDSVTGLWKCHGCPAEGDILDFIGYALFADYNTDTRPHFAEMIDALSGIGIKPQAKPPSLRVAQKAQIHLNLDKYKSMIDGWATNLAMHKGLLEWLDDRGISQGTAWDMRLGYTLPTDDRIYDGYRNRLIVPNIYRDVLVSIKYRSLPGEPKEYKHFRGSSASMMYNARSLLHEHDIAILVESELDAVALRSVYGGGVATVSTPASGFNEWKSEQFAFTRWVLYVQDNDSAGNMSASRIRKYMRRARIIRPPEQYKDIGECLQNFGSMAWLTDEIRKIRSRGE